MTHSDADVGRQHLRRPSVVEGGATFIPDDVAMRSSLSKRQIHFMRSLETSAKLGQT